MSDRNDDVNPLISGRVSAIDTLYSSRVMKMLFGSVK